MADPRKLPRNPAAGALLPALERLAPVPDLAALAAQVASRSKAGDVVLELHGRGGWVTRTALDQLRRAFTIESSALSRLVAEIVLRPPDLRHLDAAVSAIAVDARGTEGGLRSAVEATYASRCPGCGGSVVVDEFLWEAEASDPARKVFRCARCRDRRAERKPLPVDPDDLYRARALDATAASDALRERFAVPAAGHPLADELVGLYPPRARLALAALLERIESEPRAPSIQAALRLAIVHMTLPVSRLNGPPGRPAGVRIVNGQLRSPAARPWRERNAWAIFEEGTRAVRAFVQWLEAGGPRTPARVGPDLRALVDGSANVALRFGLPLGRETFGAPPRPGTQPGARPRVAPGIRLVLSQAPIHWSADDLAFAYLATSLAIGPDGAATLPLAGIFGPAPRTEWARDAATLQRSLSAVRPVLLPDAQTVLLLGSASAEALVAAVIGGAGAGLRFEDAALVQSERGLDGTLVFTLPRDPATGMAGVVAAPTERAAPLQLSAVETAISDIAVAILQLRSEPSSFERVLSEVLLGLDHLGHLRRLVGTPRPPEEVGEAVERRSSGLLGVVSHVPGEGTAASGALLATVASEPAAGGSSAGGVDVAARGTEVSAQAAGATAEGQWTASDLAGPSGWQDRAPASDPVRLTLEMIRRELRRPDHARLVELEPDLWWLRDAADLGAARTPLSERLEWAIFSLLSTSGGISQASFDERIGRLFRGPETADPQLVRACLESYRSAEPSPDGLIRTSEALPRRYAGHGEIVGMLTDYAHRLGMRAWIAKREQRRTYEGRPLAELLSDPERRVYLPLVAPGPQEALEEVDCIWYVRGRGAFLFDVEWMAALDEAVLRRGPRIETTDALVRFLVVADERVPLLRLRLQRSPLVRARLAADNWHILRWSNVRRLHATKRASLTALGPLLGIDPEVERGDDQLSMFNR
jgi:hypothetical protein